MAFLKHQLQKGTAPSAALWGKYGCFQVSLMVCQCSLMDSSLRKTLGTQTLNIHKHYSSLLLFVLMQYYSPSTDGGSHNQFCKFQRNKQVKDQVRKAQLVQAGSQKKPHSRLKVESAASLVAERMSHVPCHKFPEAMTSPFSDLKKYPIPGFIPHSSSQKCDEQ